jgi:two-component system, response regulator / RNA-binding antiterminator
VRIAVIDESAGRAAVIEEGLNEAGLTDTIVITRRTGLLARLEALAPEVVLINLENPSRDVLEEYFTVSRALSRPIAMFVDQSDTEATAAAVDAGVSAYVVDGLATNRIRPVLELAVRRFQAFSKLQTDLEEARHALASRTVVDRAKRILMTRRGMDEPAAYALLRSHAMQSNRRIAEVAQAILTAEELMGGSA